MCVIVLLVMVGQRHFAGFQLILGCDCNTSLCDPKIETLIFIFIFRFVPSLEGRSQSLESSTPVYLLPQRPGRRSR